MLLLLCCFGFGYLQVVHLDCSSLSPCLIGPFSFLRLSVELISSHYNVCNEIGLVCRANAQQPKLFVGMILILIFAEALALYGLIVGIILSSRSGQSRAD